MRPGAVVVNLIHGTYGEDGTLQGELDAAGFEYLGSDAKSSALCMNKDECKKTLAAAKISVPWGIAINPKSPPDLGQFRFPTMTGLVVKPRDEGSSVGLYMVPNPSFLIPTLEQYLEEVGRKPMLIEERLRGTEYTVAVIAGVKDADQGQALPPLAIVPQTETYDFHAKYEANDTAYEPVADGELAARLQEIAEQCFQACGCRDLARVDIMAHGDELKVLEVNTLPGFTDHSLVPKAALAGMNFQQLVEHLVQRVAQRRDAAAQ